MATTMLTLTQDYPSCLVPSKMPHNKFNIHDTQFLLNMCNIYGFSSEKNMYWASVIKPDTDTDTEINITFNISIRPPFMKTNSKINISDIHITNIQARYTFSSENYRSKRKLKMMSHTFYEWIMSELTENIDIINSGVRG
jgi:hypothetical protein